MRYVVIAPVGDRIESLYVGIREFPTEKVILLVPKKYQDNAYAAEQELEKFKIPVEQQEVSGHVWEEIFRTISQIKDIETGKELLINVSTGDRDTQCAATSAAYVNGIKAFSITENMAMVLPVLKFSYYSLLTEKKMSILRLLAENTDCCSSLEELSRKTNMSLPLMSYHINGNLKSDGLRQLGLVETKERKGRMEIQLSTLGNLLIKGYIKPEIMKANR